MSNRKSKKGGGYLQIHLRQVITMTLMNQQKKLDFEKPEIQAAEFVACNIPMLIIKSPAAVSIAASCQLPMVAGEIPVAAAY